MAMYSVQYTKRNGATYSFVFQTYWDATMFAQNVKAKERVDVRISGDGDLGPVDAE
jgi:hypothetical protein